MLETISLEQWVLMKTPRGFMLSEWLGVHDQDGGGTVVGLHIFLGYRLGKYDNPPPEK